MLGKLYCTIFFNLLIIFSISGQKLDWYIQPVLSDIDDIMIDEQTKNLIGVRKDNLWGVKTKTNEIVIPIAYKSVHISHDSKVIATFDGAKMAYFDGEGYTTTKEIGEQANTETVKKREEANRQYVVNNGGLYRIYHNKVQNYINKALDTVLRLTDTHDPVLYGDKYYVTNSFSPFISRIYDKKGNLLKTYDFPLNNLVENRQGFYTSWYAQKARLFDKDFNLIETPPCNGISIHDSLNFVVIENNKKYVIKDLKQNLLLKDSFPKSPFVASKSDNVVIPLNDHVLIYSLSTKKVDKYPFTTNYAENNNSLIIVKENGKFGIYDFLNKTYVQDAKFDFLSYTRKYFFATIGEKRSKQHEIFNADGQSIYSGYYNNFIFTNDGFILLDTLNTYNWYDKKGKLVKKFASDEYVEYNSESNTIRITPKGKDSKSYFVNEYFSQAEPKSYQALGSRLNPYSKKEVPIFLMMNSGKYGIIDINGKVILPPTFSKVIRTIQDKWFVEYNGKLGVFNLPKVPLKV